MPTDLILVKIKPSFMLDGFNCPKHKLVHFIFFCNILNWMDGIGVKKHIVCDTNSSSKLASIKYNKMKFLGSDQVYYWWKIYKYTNVSTKLKLNEMGNYL